MTTTSGSGALSPAAGRRWAGPLLAALTAVLALLLPAAPASAVTSSATETRVGASSPATAVVVGVHECITAGQRPVRGPSQLHVASGSCVAAEGGAGTPLTRVGRWMSPDEYRVVRETGIVQPGPNSHGTAYVAHPANPEAAVGQAPPGHLYVEFDVPLDSLKRAGKDEWAQIPGPESLYGRNAALHGRPVPQMPPALNIEWLATRINPWR